MDVVLIGLGAALAAVGGGFAFGFARRGREHRRWRAALDEAAKLLPDARTSAGTRYDGPELRANIDGHTVSLRIRGSGDLGEASVSVALGDRAPTGRLWLGWDVEAVPSDWEHVAETPVDTQRVEGRVHVHSDDAAFAQRVVDGAYLDLVDVRREAKAHGVVLSLRGGYLEIAYRGIETSPHLLERLARAAARIASAAPRWGDGSRLPPGSPQDRGT